VADWRISRNRTLAPDEKAKEKVTFSPLTIAKVCFCPSTLKPDKKKAPHLLKPRRFRPSAVLSMVATVTTVAISAASLKNHSKSQKIHKIKNLILLDST
jgi:hypothetical protein